MIPAADHREKVTAITNDSIPADHPLLAFFLLHVLLQQNVKHHLSSREEKLQTFPLCIRNS